MADKSKKLKSALAYLRIARDGLYCRRNMSSCKDLLSVADEMIYKAQTSTILGRQENEEVLFSKAMNFYRKVNKMLKDITEKEKNV